MYLTLICVGTGGFIGSAGRVLLSFAISKLFPAAFFPLGTFIVNIAGCFFIGLFLNLPQLGNPNAKAFLTAGLMGGFTTFSTFSYDNLKLLSEGHLAEFFLNITMSVLIGILFCYLGALAGKAFN